MAKKRTKKPSSTKKSKTALKPQGKASRRKAVDIFPVDPAIATPQASNQAVGPIGAVEPTPEEDETANRAFWRLTRDDEDVDLRHRLQASELLGKSRAMFTEVHTGKVEFEGKIIYEVGIQDAHS